MQGVRRRFGPLLAFKECVDSKGSYDYEKDLAFLMRLVTEYWPNIFECSLKGTSRNKEFNNADVRSAENMNQTMQHP